MKIKNENIIFKFFKFGWIFLGMEWDFKIFMFWDINKGWDI